MSSTKRTSWINARIGAPTGGSQYDSRSVPVQVIDAKTVVRARGLAGVPMEVPAGRYMVMATTPDGRQWTADDFVQLEEGETKAVPLLAEGVEAESPAPAGRPELTLAPGASIVADSEELERHVAVRRGKWLDYWIQSTAKTPISRRTAGLPSFETVAGDTFDLSPDPNEDTLIEVVTGETASYFAVPFEGIANSRTRVSISASVLAGPVVAFNFEDPELDDLLKYVVQGHAEDARTISRALVNPAEKARKTGSPLREVIGAYVLIRANELDGLDAWTGSMSSKVGDVIPDTLALRVETLARLGRHEDAIAMLVDYSASPRMPWFRSGVGYLTQRLDLYLKLANASPPSLKISQKKRALLAKVLRGVSSVSWAIDQTTSLCVFRQLERIPPPRG